MSVVRPSDLMTADPQQMTGRSSSVVGGHHGTGPASIAARVRRGAGGSGPVGGGMADTGSGSAPMGGRTPAKDLWGDGMINETDRGSAHDHRRPTPQMTIG